MFDEFREFNEARPYIEIAYKLNKRHDKVSKQYVTELVKEDNISEAVLILEGLLVRNTTYNPAKKLLKK